jgi:alanine racemase
MIDVPFNHPAWIEIDLIAFKKNLQTIRAHIGGSVKLCLPVKSNAYGHGLIPIARAAASEVDCLAVSCLQEAVLLRNANIKIPIIVLGAIHTEQIAAFIEYDLEFTVSSNYKAQAVANACKLLNKKVKIHLEVDTGMNRTGVRIETALDVLNFIRSEPCFNLVGVYSHLAPADVPNHNFTLIQIEKFVNFLKQNNLYKNKDVTCHLSNSAGMACLPQSHLDMVRPGLLAFGYYPRADIPDVLHAIKPIFSIRAKVAYFKTVLKGEGISYNHTYVAPKDTRVLTIPVGYGDGVRRALSNKASVLLNGQFYPIVGNICMDQFMVDIGEGSGFIGDIVTIIGDDHNASITIEEHSKLCGTIPYEILCGFNNRLPRVYHTAMGNIWEDAEHHIALESVAQLG